MITYDGDAPIHAPVRPDDGFHVGWCNEHHAVTLTIIVRQGKAERSTQVHVDPHVALHIGAFIFQTVQENAPEVLQDIEL